MAGDSTKRCTTCGRSYPDTAAHFRTMRSKRDGSPYLSRQCKPCAHGRAVATRQEWRAKAEGSTTLDDELRAHRDVGIGKHRDRRHRDALQRIAELEAQLEAVARLREASSVLEIKPRHSGLTGEATAVACLSDVHVGARVTPEQVNFLNSYDVATARERCGRFFERLVKLTRKERQDVRIDELILFLGGDLIDGALHLDTIMSGDVAEPMSQAVIAQEILEGGLRYVVENGGFRRITVVCKDGNHGRTTVKMHHASRAGNSLEWFLYYNLRARLPKLNWIVETSLHSYVRVYDLVVRFHHGDTIHGGGVGGFYQYLNRRRYQWNTANRADLDVLAHLHQYTATKRFVVNGSVVGFSPYAVSIGAEFEKPMQAFFLLDKKRGMTINAPIFLN